MLLRASIRHPARRLAVLLALLGVAAPGCGPRQSPTDAILEFCEAVQAEDLERLRCLSAGATDSEELGDDPAARRAGFERWARAQYESYLTGRDEGQVELEPHGIQLVRLLALGRGTYSRFAPARWGGPGVRTVRAELRFGYDAVDLSIFSPGTTIYLGGVPVGTVHPVEIPSGGGEIELEVLDRLAVEWTLVHAAAGEGCGAGWKVASVAPVPRSERSAQVRWVF